MTNPNDAIGTNAAYNGRTSVNAFNDDLAPYSRGILSGWSASPAGGLKIAFGGDGSTRDVAVAEDNAGNKVSINNISGSPVEVSISSAPGSNSRIDAIVAYVDNPPQGVETVADNPGTCGIISVDGTASSSPTKPNDGAIRSAITADGASGATAYYAVLAYVTVASGTTDITATDIQAGSNAAISSQNIDFETFPTLSTAKSVGNTWTDHNSFTVPASGLYFIKISAISASAGSTKFQSSCRCLITSTNSSFNTAEAYSVANWAGNNFTTIYTSNVIWLKAGEVIKSQGKNENWTGSLTVNLFITRIH